MTLKVNKGVEGETLGRVSVLERRGYKEEREQVLQMYMQNIISM